MWAGWLDGNNWNCTSTTFPPVESRGPSLAGRPALIAITRDVWCGYYRADKEVVGRRELIHLIYFFHIFQPWSSVTSMRAAPTIWHSVENQCPRLRTGGRQPAIGETGDEECERVKSRFGRDSIIFSFYLKESFWLITRVKRIKCK